MEVEEAKRTEAWEHVFHMGRARTEQWLSPAVYERVSEEMTAGDIPDVEDRIWGELGAEYLTEAQRRYGERYAAAGETESVWPWPVPETVPEAKVREMVAALMEAPRGSVRAHALAYLIWIAACIEVVADLNLSVGGDIEDLDWGR